MMYRINRRKFDQRLARFKQQGVITKRHLVVLDYLGDWRHERAIVLHYKEHTPVTRESVMGIIYTLSGLHLIIKKPA